MRLHTDAQEIRQVVAVDEERAISDNHSKLVFHVEAGLDGFNDLSGTGHPVVREILVIDSQPGRGKQKAITYAMRSQGVETGTRACGND